MPRIFLGKPFALEDVAQMSVAVITNNFNASAIGVGLTANGVGNLVIKTWPTTTRVKFVFGAIQRRIAPSTNIGPWGFVIVVLAGARSLGSLVQNYIRFGFVQWVIFRH